MRVGTERDQLILELKAARDRVLEAVSGLSEEQASRRAPDGWSVKDHLAHLTLWHEMRFFEISRIARGGRASFPITGEEGIDHLNEQFAANRRNLPYSQVLADLAFAHEMVLQAVAAAPEDRLDQRLFEEIGLRGGAAHDRDHAEMIAAWRQKEGI